MGNGGLVKGVGAIKVCVIEVWVIEVERNRDWCSSGLGDRGWANRG